MTESNGDDPIIRVTNKRVLGDDDIAAAADTADEQPLAVEEVDELAAARAETAQHLEDLQRLKAEFENYRKRVVKEQTALVERASAAVVARLLPILDNFELALIAADRTKDYTSMVRGVELVYSELLELLKKEGLERLEVLGKQFDPEEHEAVMHAEGDGDVTVVVDEMRPGYRFGGRIIRPAMVKVGRRPTE